MTRRRGLVMLLIAILLAGLTTMVIVKQLGSWRSQHSGEPKLSVVMVVKSVSPHQVVDSSDVVIQQVAQSAVSATAETSLSAVVGKYSTSQWYPGQQVLQEMVVGNPQVTAFPLSIPNGYRAMTIADDSVLGVDHLISVGDHVDVLVSYTDKAENGPIVHMVLQNIQVLYVDNSPQSTTSTTASVGGTSSNTKSSSTVDTLTVAVTPQQAAMIDFARTFGQLTLLLRNPTDHQQMVVPNQTAPMATVVN